jgi:hypothetical protein
MHTKSCMHTNAYTIARHTGSTVKHTHTHTHTHTHKEIRIQKHTFANTHIYYNVQLHTRSPPEVRLGPHGWAGAQAGDLGSNRCRACKKRASASDSPWFHLQCTFVTRIVMHITVHTCWVPPARHVCYTHRHAHHSVHTLAGFHLQGTFAARISTYTLAAHITPTNYVCNTPICASATCPFHYTHTHTSKPSSICYTHPHHSRFTHTAPRDHVCYTSPQHSCLPHTPLPPSTSASQHKSICPLFYYFNTHICTHCTPPTSVHTVPHCIHCTHTVHAARHPHLYTLHTTRGCFTNSCVT